MLSIRSSERPTHPDRRTTLRAIAPFCATAIVGFGLALVPGRPVIAGQYALALALLVCGVLLRVYVKLKTRLNLLPTLLFLASVGVLRNATGGMIGGIGILVLLAPVFTALNGTRRQLHLVLIATTLTLLVPQVLIGAPTYPATGWRSMILSVSLAAIMGHTVQRLLERQRGIAEQLRERERERDQLIDQLQALAATDPLTDVPNRRSFDQQLRAAIDLPTTRTRGLCLAVIDIDHFKAINDRDGHAAGDQILRDCTRAWSEALRPSDTLARLGGDEFAVLLPACRPDDAAIIIDRLRLSSPDGVTISAGLAAHQPGQSADNLLHNADSALYVSKRRGRNQLHAHPVA